jgi:hypothetical protein
MARSHATLVFLILLLPVAGAIKVRSPEEAPDTILINGHVFTGTEARPYAEAIAIKGARILAVDSTEKISSMSGPKTRRRVRFSLASLGP